MRFGMSDTDPPRVYQQLRPPSPVPQVLQVEHRGRSYRWVLQHANVGAYTRERRRGGHPIGHSHPESYHLLLYTRGDSDALLEGRVQPVRPGTLVLSPPGDVHDFGPASVGELAYVQLTFAFLDERGGALAMSFADLLGAWSGLDLPDRGVVLQLEERRREELSACILRAYEAAESGNRTSHLDVRLEMAALFGWLTREVYVPAGADAGRDSAGTARMAVARAYLEANYRKRISVADLARTVFLSEGYFLRAFKRAYGVTPIACQLALRVQAARGMLRFTSLSCKEIAARLGYADAYHFSKSFKKMEGCSPTAYRRRADPI